MEVAKGANELAALVAGAMGRVENAGWQQRRIEGLRYAVYGALLEMRCYLEAQAAAVDEYPSSGRGYYCSCCNLWTPRSKERHCEHCLDEVCETCLPDGETLCRDCVPEGEHRCPECQSRQVRVSGHCAQCGASQAAACRHGRKGYCDKCEWEGTQESQAAAEDAEEEVPS